MFNGYGPIKWDVAVVGTEQKERTYCIRKSFNPFILIGGAKGDRTPDLMTASLGPTFTENY